MLLGHLELLPSASWDFRRNGGLSESKERGTMQGGSEKAFHADYRMVLSCFTGLIIYEMFRYF